MKHKLSINPAIRDKDVPDRQFFVAGWQNVEFTIPELAESVRAGIPYCAQLKGPRRSQNFLASDIASVDVDSGMTIPEALEHDLVREGAGLIYTTPTHTPDRHRFRIVFPLPRTIVDPIEMAALNRSLSLRLSGDPSAVDPTRVFFGNTRAEIILLNG